MDDVFTIIATPTATREALIGAIRQLGPITEPASFWSAIANDAAYRPDHRRRAVFALFRRHAAPGATLADLARLLDNPTWLNASDISVVEVLGGKIPVTWTFDDTVLVFGVLPDLPDEDASQWAIYLRVAGKVDVVDARAALTGGAAPAAVQQAAILEIGFASPDLDHTEA